MKQINCNLAGKITAPPTYLIDNGHRYTMTIESPSRGYIVVPDEEPSPYGSHILWADQVVHLLTPPPGFVGELTDPQLQCQPHTEVLQFPAALERIGVSGLRFVGANGRPYQRKGVTGFCDFQLFTEGNLAQLSRVWGQTKDCGGTERRVFGMMKFITDFGIHTIGEAWFQLLPAFLDYAASADIRINFSVFQDEQAIGDPKAKQQQIWARVVALWAPYAGIHPLCLGNELSKNGVDAGIFPAPPFWASQGSEVADTPPPMPGWGEREWHGRRDFPKYLESSGDLTYVSRGLRQTDAGWEKYAPDAPGHHSEPLGAAEVVIPGRRYTDPEIARRLALDALAHGDAFTFHAEDPIYSRPMGPRQQACARAAFEVLS